MPVKERLTMCKDVYRGAEMEKDTPVTKLDSVERLVEKSVESISDVGNLSMEWGTDTDDEVAGIVRAALTEMWDLSRREALREAEYYIRSQEIDSVGEYNCLIDRVAEGLHRLTGKDGKR
jgi:hypothetical protein